MYPKIKHIYDPASIITLVLLILFLLPNRSLGQDSLTSEIGIPFIQSFNPEDYQASPQNWDIVQDSIGFIYIANGRGLLIYNGEDFQLLKMPDGHSVRSLAIDKDNRIYCGGAGYFGYLAYKGQGEVNFVNLADSTSSVGQKAFSNVEDIYCTPKGIFFRSPEKLFLWKNAEFKIWNSGDHRFLATFWANDQLYINRKNLGIQILSDEGDFLPFGEDSLLLGEIVTMIVPRGDDLMIGTSDQLFLWRETSLINFSCPAGDLISTSRLFKGRSLKNGTYTLSTLNDGMLIMDQWGQILLHANSESGLPSNTVYQVFEDRENQLWVASNNGFALMEYPSPFSRFEIGNKTPPISALVRYKNDLIVGTFNGLFRLKKSKYPPASLEPYLGITDRIWDLLVIDDDLFIAFEDGLYIYVNNESLKKIDTDAISVICQSKIDSNRIFVGGRKGLYALYFSDGSWKRESMGVTVGDGIYHIHEQEDGTLWLDVNRSWIYRISFPNKNDASNLFQGILTKLDTSAGLPKVNGYVMMHRDQIYYVDKANLTMLHYDPLAEIFKSDFAPDSGFLTSDKNLVISNDDQRGNNWIVEFEQDVVKNTFLLGPGDNADKAVKLSESRLYDLIGRCIYYDDRVLWHGGQNSLIRNDVGKSSILPTFNTIIDKVYYREDSLLQAGPYSTASYQIPFSKNSFRFVYANTAHVANKKVQYQYHLEGLTDGWSAWSTERKRDFTNLMEGTYTFRVRARSIGGHLGREDTFVFNISAPWHRSYWAYFLYILAGIVGTGSLIKWRSRKLQKEKIFLQNIVQLRTSELEVRNEQLEEQKSLLSNQAIALRDMDRFKSRLFANISHEFRTPLTLIKGPLERLKRFPDRQLTSEHIEMMDRNANRLLRLVNQVLDLSKLETKDLPLNPAEGNVLKSIRTAASTFSSHAADRNLDYQIVVPAGQLWAAFDRDKLEKIIYNLLSNAFKFTSDSGTIKFCASHANEVLHLEVIDTGRGISSADLPRIFDRFYQADHSDAKEQEGSGVGLSLVKELIVLMGGTIHVDSILNQGSSFFVELPMDELNRATTGPEITEGLTLTTEDEKPNSGLEKQTGAPANAQTILLVEDNPDMRAYIREHLDGVYKVLEAYNGPEGVKIALKNMPDLIITDLMMPKMDGLELSQIIKSDLLTSHIPIIILTAKAGLENRLEGLETGADVYLTKPFHAEELLVQISRLIEDRSRLRALFSRDLKLGPKDLKLPKLDQQFIERVLQVLEDNYSQADFDVPSLHQILAMSRTQLHRKMKALTGMAPGEFIRNFRLKRAAQILLTGENVTQTAYSVGFNNLSYFARSFRALYGASPKEYSNHHLGG